MNRSLDSLAPNFRPLAVELLARCAEARIPVVIINTRRTAAEQSRLRQQGRSWLKRSKHQDGLAIDIAAYQWYALGGVNKLQWDAEDPVWQKLGSIGETLGLVWGGRWQKRDMGHFELKT